jgi:hypothetical protein
MRLRPPTALALLLAALVLLAGCGGGATTAGRGTTPAGGSHPVAFDPRNGPLGCLTANGIQAVKDPRETDRLDILPASSGVSIQFAATPEDAQGRQLRDEAPGAEVIGPHLLTVGTLPDAELNKIETCLQAQGSKY